MDPNDALSRIQENVVKRLADLDIADLQKDLSVPAAKASEGRDFPATVLDAIATVVTNTPSNKYIFSIVIAACLKKIITPEQDIRIAQDGMPNGYSNRSLDQRVVTPFLRRQNYTHCEASGLESGRNLERPLVWDLDFACKPRGRGNRESFLAILDFVQKGGDPFKVIEYMLYLDATRRETAATVQHAPLEQNIAKIIKVFERHFAESSGQGKSRLPVLALYSIYEPLVDEVGRYSGTVLLPLERHTTADLRSGSIGDIQVDKGGMPFEGVEVKSEKPITADMVYELSRKFGDRKISRYYILSTFEGSYKEEDAISIELAVGETQGSTGTQIIVNGLIKTLWYYMRLLNDPSRILETYSVLLNSDPDVRPELIETWNRIVEEEYPEDV